MAATRDGDDDPDWENERRRCLCAMLLGAICVVGIVLAFVYGLSQTRYDISIDSASLPLSKDLALLDPQFNLTFRLASDSPGRSACVDAGTYVIVSYHCVPLAASAAAPHQICVGPKKSMSMPLVAKGTAVHMPGYMMDSLAADLRNGVEAFEVTFKLSGDSDNYVTSCGVRRVGDVAAECDRRYTCPDRRDETTTSFPMIVVVP